MSFAAMYAVPHPANEAATWLKANAPEGAVMLKEHWEEGLRGLEGYQHRELPMYNADTTREGCAGGDRPGGGETTCTSTAAASSARSRDCLTTTPSHTT